MISATEVWNCETTQTSFSSLRPCHFRDAATSLSSSSPVVSGVPRPDLSHAADNSPHVLEMRVVSCSLLENLLPESSLAGVRQARLTFKNRVPRPQEKEDTCEHTYHWKSKFVSRITPLFHEFIRSQGCARALGLGVQHVQDKSSTIKYVLLWTGFPIVKM